jgi:hypothetical protein
MYTEIVENRIAYLLLLSYVARVKEVFLIISSDLIRKVEETFAEIPSDTPLWARTLILACQSLFTQVKSLNKCVSNMTKLQGGVQVQQPVTDTSQVENKRLLYQVVEL